uniref:Polyhomeotic-like protein 2 n=1 Tax=Heterorhabditis bacteriophora TaxID=37862 RepID=A0A1I7WFX2_HETBA
MLKLCSAEAMPSGWTTQHDKELIAVCDQHGIDNISANILQKPAFQKIRQQQQMRALMQQTMLSQMSDLPLAAAMLQSAMFMPQLMGNNAAAAQLLTSLFAMAGASGSGTNARNSSTGGSGSAASGQGATSTTILPSSACASNSESDILNLTKKAMILKVEVTTSQSPVASSSTQQSQLAQSGTLSQLGLNELLILASLPPGKESSMPSVSAASTIDSTPSSAKPSAPPTPKPSTPKPISAAPTPAPATPATPKPTPSPK